MVPVTHTGVGKKSAYSMIMYLETWKTYDDFFKDRIK